MGQHYVTHSIWTDTGKTMCGRFVPHEAIAEDDAPTCKTCCKALDYHFGDDDD